MNQKTIRSTVSVDSKPKYFSLLTTIACLIAMTLFGCGDGDDGDDDGGGGGSGAAAWTQVGGQIGPDGAEAEDPTILFSGSTPVVGYRYASFEIALNQWDGDTWGSSVSDPSSGDMYYTSYHAPSYCSSGSTIFMPYSHAGESSMAVDEFYDRIFVYSWTPGAGWNIMNSGAEVSVITLSDPGANAFEASIACAAGSNPWVSWIEDDALDSTDDVGFVQVTATSTQSRATPLSRNNASASYYTSVRSSEVLIDGTNRYVAQWEHDAEDQDQTDLYVSSYNGAAFTSMGGIIDSDYDSNDLSKPSMAVFGGELHIAYTTTASGGSSRNLYVKKYSGGVWETVGGGPVTAFESTHYDSGNPSLLTANSKLYIAWNESDTYEGPFIFVAYLDAAGTAWEIDGNKLNVDQSNSALDPCLTYYDGYLYVAFEEGTTDGHPHIFVKRKSIL